MFALLVDGSKMEMEMVGTKLQGAVGPKIWYSGTPGTSRLNLLGRHGPHSGSTREQPAPTPIRCRAYQARLREAEGHCFLTALSSIL